MFFINILVSLQFARLTFEQTLSFRTANKNCFKYITKFIILVWKVPWKFMNRVKFCTIPQVHLSLSSKCHYSYHQPNNSIRIQKNIFIDFCKKSIIQIPCLTGTNNHKKPLTELFSMIKWFQNSHHKNRSIFLLKPLLPLRYLFTFPTDVDFHTG